MVGVIRYLMMALGRMLVRLRYWVRVHGLEKVRDLKGGTLVLPNHPAYMDPVIVFSFLYRTLKPRPLLYEGNFRSPVLYPLMQLVRAVPVPNLERPSAKARARTERAIADVVATLRRGENVIMWPSGKLWWEGQEHIGGAQAVSQILQAVPEANVVLVRTRGLWGSKSSHIGAGGWPKFYSFLRAAPGRLLANLIFFAPRRPVDVTVEPIDRATMPALGRDTLNPWLEKWYNVLGPEPPTFVPYHFLFGRRTYQFPAEPPQDPLLGQVAAATRNEVFQVVERKLKRKLTEAEKKPDTVLHEMGMDSLDRMDVTLTVEQRFGFSTEQSPWTVGDLLLLAQGLGRKAKTERVPRLWFRPPKGQGKPEITGATIAEAFVHRALAHPGDAAAADDQAGVLSYGRMLAGSLTLARRFTILPGINVGLLMPASVGGDVALLALQLAGKVPVLLNWTTGPANLEHAVRLLELRHVVTSNLFIDRLEENIVAAVKNTGAQLLCLEDLRAEIGRWELLRTLLAVRLRPGRIRRLVPLAKPDQPAVVLFTSGSEKAPKAVPLTHHNLLSNQRACLTVLALTRQDAVLGFLPSFHSFGLSLTGLMPLLSGLRVVRHPDPTAATTLVRKIADYQPTLLAGTPTFISAILERGADKLEQLASLKLAFAGAEKCPEELVARCARLPGSVKLLEGYGITECAPVISVNPPTASRTGTVGRPLPGVEVCVVELKDPETQALGDELPHGSMGMLLVHGPNVFPGYIGQDTKPPFVERAGKRWYITGDLAELDADGYIRLAGRLKRFLKVGGEMISLPALEGPLVGRYPPTDDGPRMAVEGTETPRRIVLFTTIEITQEEVNDLLHQEGFRGIMRIDAVWRLEQLPVLGTGKTDYKRLRAQVQGSHAQPGAAGG
jgi:long-chain-fatty-acid--[acyl-carrier-protein] ligase